MTRSDLSGAISVEMWSDHRDGQRFMAFRDDVRRVSFHVEMGPAEFPFVNRSWGHEASQKLANTAYRQFRETAIWILKDLPRPPMGQLPFTLTYAQLWATHCYLQEIN